MAEEHTGKNAIQVKVRRLIDGQRNPRDLDAIFLWLRTKSFGSQIVKDIGDLVAHSDDRDKGVVWGHALRTSSMFRYVFSTLNRKDKPVLNDLENLKANARAVFEIDDAESVKTHTGYSKKKGKTDSGKRIEKILFCSWQFSGVWLE